MRTNRDRSKFLQYLEDTPFVYYAAKKAGIAPATIYRWMKDNAVFKKEVDKAINEGRDKINDIAEMKLIKKIEAGEMRAIVFYLTHNNRRYVPKRSIYVEPKRELKAGEKCDSCGSEKVEIMSMEKFNQEMRDYVKYIDKLAEDK